MFHAILLTIYLTEDRKRLKLADVRTRVNAHLKQAANMASGLEI
jgi:hypothetical protein